MRGCIHICGRHSNCFKEERKEMDTSEEDEDKKPKRIRKKAVATKKKLQKKEENKPNASSKAKKAAPKDVTAIKSTTRVSKKQQKQEAPEENEEGKAPDLEEIKYTLALETGNLRCLSRANVDDLEMANLMADEYINNVSEKIGGIKKTDESSSTISDDGKLKIDSDSSKEDQTQPIKPSSRMVFGKAIEAITPTAPFRGIIKGVITTSDANPATTAAPIFGVYCIKWRRNGSKDENESKFVVSGLDIDEPPLNIYCSIEEKMFVKVPMTLKVVLKNPTSKVVHLISTLSVSNSDNFMCSGHKQLDISIFAYSEKELVFNLYPLKVGWQNLPELHLEYNTLTDPSRDESQNQLLSHLVQRSMPKKVFVLPPYKQHSNGVK